MMSLPSRLCGGYRFFGLRIQLRHYHFFFGQRDTFATARSST